MGTKHKTHKCISKAPGYDSNYVRFVRAFSKNRFAVKYMEKFGKKGVEPLYKQYLEGRDLDICVLEALELIEPQYKV